MPISLEITDRAGTREVELDEDAFWIGGLRSECPVCIDLPGVFGRVLEVARDERGRLRVRAEPGLPFPVRCATGTIGARFENLLDGDTLNVGPALVRVRHRAAAASAAEELDPAALSPAPGSPVGSWYRTFMEMADHLEGLKSPAQMVPAAMAAILRATGADRVHVLLDLDQDDQAYFMSRPEDRRPFRVSRSLVEQVRDSGRVVHVPVAASDPVARTFHSVRSEGISAAVALPIQALGKNLGVIYADCTRDGAQLTAEDLQRVAFCGRILATALGNRVLVRSLLDRPAPGGQARHWALETGSPACAEFVQRVELYAPADYTVLLRGETGTGKEVVARALHELSRRSKGPFVPVNCAAIPEQLMESMLFGHEKGAFTGALQARRGHFEEAHGGTIFLDEIGDMALGLQAKILRVLQDRIVTPVGGRRQVRVDVRILAATHQDLERMVREGRFREDLYYRLRELEIVLPPLRDRREDVRPLAQRFLAEAAEELGFAEVPALSAEAEAALVAAPWRGNIRELRHVVKGAALRAGGGTIRPAHLDLDRASSGPPAAVAPGSVAPGAATPVAGEAAGAGTWKERLEQQEKEALQRTLAAANGNLTRAAELFGVPRTTYRERLVRHGLLDA
ncbi:MAG: sigma-54-dependent Fis family transcriptional regulator [Planctomycetes bacterium]|nr:sigma-54-dependent Fis family transcriptional regulator [Planctomycetota bacterium]